MMACAPGSASTSVACETHESRSNASLFFSAFLISSSTGKTLNSSSVLGILIPLGLIDNDHKRLTNNESPPPAAGAPFKIRPSGSVCTTISGSSGAATGQFNRDSASAAVFMWPGTW